MTLDLRQALRLAHLDVAQEWERQMAVHQDPFKNPATAAYAAGLDFASSRLYKRVSEAMEAQGVADPWGQPVAIEGGGR